MAEPREWVLELRGRPTLLNAERGGHWGRRHEQTKLQRAEACALAREQQIPRLDCIAVWVQPVLRNRVTQDLGACFPTAKAAIDGLVDAGVLEHDGAEHVQLLAFMVPKLQAGRDGLLLTVREL